MTKERPKNWLYGHSTLCLPGKGKSNEKYLEMSRTIHNPTFSIIGAYFKRYLAYGQQSSVKNSYNILFLGSDSIALRSLRKINEFRKTGKVIKRLDLVTCNNASKKSEIEEYACSENITIRKWPLPNIYASEYDLGLIVAFGHLIKDDILNKFPLGMINVHPSLLPRWRGAAPIIYTLLHGDQETGVTLMKIKPNRFDVGEIINQRKIKVCKDIKLPELTEKLSDIGAEMLVDCIKLLPESLMNLKPQGNDGVTYAKKIKKSICEVQWSIMSSVEVYNLYRAIYGLYSLTTKFKDKQVKLFDAFLCDSNDIHSKTMPIGTVTYCDKTNSIKVLCEDRKYIHFKSLRIVGKREISALDFFNGYIKNMPREKRFSLVFC